MRVCDAAGYLNKFRQLPRGWKLVIRDYEDYFVRHPSVSAITVYENKTIYFNKKQLKYFNLTNISVILRHELAHAKTGYSRRDHGRNWYKAALAMGWTLERDYEVASSYFRGRHWKLRPWGVWLKMKRNWEKYYIPKNIYRGVNNNER